MTQCKGDIAKFCADKSHVGREIRVCLEGKKEELNAECKAALESTGPGRGMGKAGKGRQSP